MRWVGEANFQGLRMGLLDAEVVLEGVVVEEKVEVVVMALRRKECDVP